MSAFPIAYPRTIPICSTRCSLITITFVVQLVQKRCKQCPVRVSKITIIHSPGVCIVHVVDTPTLIFYLPHELSVVIRECAVTIVRVTQSLAVASSVTGEDLSPCLTRRKISVASNKISITGAQNSSALFQIFLTAGSDFTGVTDLAYAEFVHDTTPICQNKTIQKKRNTFLMVFYLLILFDSLLSHFMLKSFISYYISCTTYPFSGIS